MEDNHDPFKIVLQRQFFEAIARAAAVKFASGCDDLPTLSAKLDHLFKNNLIPLAVKNRSKTVEQVKEWRLVEKVFEDETIAQALMSVYLHFSSKKGNTFNGRTEETITLDELLEMLRRAKLIENQGADESEQFTVKDIVCAVERYYDPKDTLATKVSD